MKGPTLLEKDVFYVASKKMLPVCRIKLWCEMNSDIQISVHPAFNHKVHFFLEIVIINES